MTNITVLGAGSWGTALALLLNSNSHNVTLWSYNKEHIKLIQSTGKNSRFLPDVTIPKSINATYDIEQAITRSKYIVCALPSVAIKSAMELIKRYTTKEHVIVNSSKGLYEDKLCRLSELIRSIIGDIPMAVLSGPSHAEEVVMTTPSACVVASHDIQLAINIQNLFMNKNFRVYVNKDVVGVEIGAALKNVIALATGISDGLSFGDNTKAALITRGINEISRLGIALGANRETFFGLTGIGDLIVTCTSMHSRNRKAGILIGRGVDIELAIKDIGMVAEGINTAKSAKKLALKHGVNTPIISEVYDILFKQKKPKQAVMNLMLRDKTFEYIEF